ncbi:ParB/RepB/Spo0J family partition protein [Maribacter algicola]|uniref:ParB/RepB/Spo0J family partition protein n=1 Tax=Maribacter algicola TaxID=2498892 RepID=A0A3R8Q4I9_9FLAO|nr:ParB/RepB/Spo0J family partition protein [Maribacter algicola]
MFKENPKNYISTNKTKSGPKEKQWASRQEKTTNSSGKVEDVPQIQMLEIGSVSPKPRQPRKTFDDQSPNHLAQSFAEHEVLQPNTLHNYVEGYIIVMGERRFHDSKLAVLTNIGTMVRDYVDPEVLEVQIIENLQ